MSDLLHYPVLTPTKLGGRIVKPPACVTLSADEAEPYLAAGVLGEGRELQEQAQNESTAANKAPETAPPPGKKPPAKAAKAAAGAADAGAA